MKVTANTQNMQIARKYKNELAAKLSGIRPYSLDTQTINHSNLSLLEKEIKGLGYGAKVINGQVSSQICVRVYVDKKLPMSQISRWKKIPSEVNGLPTDVIEIGDVFAMQRPTKCGVSVGHYKVAAAGTLGCLVERSNKQRYILSNNHVLANTNKAAPKDRILEPSLIDGGNTEDPIAYLTDFEEIKWDEPNIMDAAIAKLVNPLDVESSINTIGYVQHSPMIAELGQPVCKYGRTTRLTQGVIVDISADFNVIYDFKSARFEEQLVIEGINGIFSKPGDSGSLIVDEQTKKPVALLFAGYDRFTLANPISPVIERFDVSILGNVNENSSGDIDDKFALNYY